MDKYLNNLGQWVARNKFKTLLVWLLALAAFVIGVVQMGSNFETNLKISGVPSTDIQKTLEKEFKQNGDAGTLKVVVKSQHKGDILKPEMQKAISTAVEKAQKDTKHVKTVTNPYVAKTISKDLTTTYVDVTFKQDASVVSQQTIKKVKKAFSNVKDKNGVKVAYTGSVDVTPRNLGVMSELIGILIAFILLLVLFRSFIAAGLPIISAIIGLGAGLLVVTIGSNIWTIASVAQTLSIMIGLAVGIDYALFILNRYKLALGDEKDREKALGLALATAGSSVLFAGVTVIIAVSGLSLVGVDFLAQMGIAAAVGVAFAVLSALTLLPAMISCAGRFIKPTIAKKSKKNNKNGMINRTIIKHPFVTAVLSVLVLLGIALPATHMRLGMPYNGSLPTNRTERKAYDIISDKFGEGVNAQLVTVAKLDKSDTIKQKQEKLQKIYNKVSKMKNVSFVTPAQLSPSKKYALMVIIPKTGPESVKTDKLAQRVNNYSKETKKNLNTTITLTGSNAVNIDITDKLNKAIPIFAGFVIILAFILLMAVFKSFVIPIVAMAGFGLSLFASFGFATLVMQDGWMNQFFGISKGAPLLAFLPVIVIGVLFGLAMDYEVFLVSRIREEYLLTGDNDRSIQVGIKESGPVIITAALIMIAVFGSFAISTDPTIKSIGLALSFGVLFDAFVVRLTFVPAMIKIFGRLNWIFPRTNFSKFSKDKD